MSVTPEMVTAGRLAFGDTQLIGEDYMARSLSNAFSAMKALDPEWVRMREALELSPVFAPSDAPDWLRELTPQSYAIRRNQEIASMKRQLDIGEGQTMAGWIGEAAGMLQAIGQTSPEFGSLHHSTLILAERLHAISAALQDTTNHRGEG